MILVAGGTGRLGTLLVGRLAARGLDVRVLTRDPARAHHLGDSATDIVEGDVRDRASIDAAMRGITTVVIPRIAASMLARSRTSPSTMSVALSPR